MHAVYVIFVHYWHLSLWNILIVITIALFHRLNFHKWPLIMRSCAIHFMLEQVSFLDVLSFSYNYKHCHIWCCETSLLAGFLLFKEVLRSGGRKLLLFHEQLFHMLNVVFQPNKFHSQMFYLSHTNTTILTFVCNCTRKIITNILTFGKLDVVRLLSSFSKKSWEVAAESRCQFLWKSLIFRMLKVVKQTIFNTYMDVYYFQNQDRQKVVFSYHRYK